MTTATQFSIDKEAAKPTVRRFVGLVQRILKADQTLRLFTIRLDTSAGQGHCQKSGGGPNIIDPASIASDETFEKTIAWLESGPHARLEQIYAQIRHVHNQHPQLTLSLQRAVPYNRLNITWDGTTAASNAAILDAIRDEYVIVPDDHAALVTPERQRTEEERLLAATISKFAESDATLRHTVGEIATRLGDQFNENERKFRDRIENELGRIRAEEERGRARLEEERTHLRAAVDDERADLKRQREEFEAERKAWNDNESKVVRRDLLNKILRLLTEPEDSDVSDAASGQNDVGASAGGMGKTGGNSPKAQVSKRGGKAFSLSETTNEKAAPVKWACGFLTLLAIAGICVAGQRVIFVDDVPKWHHILPLSSSILILVTTIVYYIRWNNGWLMRHADLEIRSQLLRHDMLRASWFAEMLFQYKDERQAPLPESVIQVMTKNLFTEQGGTEAASHPVDDLAKFVQRINRVRVGEVEMEARTSKDTKA